MGKPAMKVRAASLLLLAALAVSLAPQTQQSAQAKQEIGIDQFTVVDRRNDQILPRIDGDRVVWQDYRDIGAHTGDDLNADIYTRNVRNGDETRIADNHLSSYPDVSGDLIVWADKSNGDADIRAYDVRRDEFFWVARRSGSEQTRPAIDGDLAVWQDNRDGTWDVRGKNLETDEEFWVTHREDNQMLPRISGRLVVWEDDRDGCCDVYVKNLDTGDVSRLTESNDAHEPDIAGKWVVYRRGDGDGAGIWAYNLETGDRQRLNTSREGRRMNPSVSGRLAVWADRRNDEDFNIFGFDFETQSEFAISRAEEDQTQPAVSGRRVVWLDLDSDRGAQVRGANLQLPSTEPTPTPTPSPAPGAACPANGPAIRDARYFSQTGFRIDDDVIWNYFVHRGGVKNFGYPVSRTVTFMGAPTQFFQRQIVQVNAGGSAQLINLLDPEWMPATTINFSTYPGVDPNVKGETPAVGSPGYATRIIDYTASVAPDSWRSLPVRFFSTFVGQVTLQDAFPLGGGGQSLLPLLNLEMSGAPTSRPQADPNNASFVYQRFQRTIFHYDAASNVTQPVLLADYFKDVLMGRAPADLMGQMAGTPFISQYNPNAPLALNRPDQLQLTNLCGAFERQ